MDSTAPARHRVTIVGGGFGGIYAARRLGRDERIDLTLVDRRNHHLFQPLLYQVATAGLSPGEIAAPIRAILRKHPNVNVVLAEVTSIDVAGKCVVLRDGEVVPNERQARLLHDLRHV